MYFLGLDGGGTKTAAILLDEQQNVLAKEVGLATNHHNLGVKKATDNICELIKNIQNQYDFTKSETVIGLALAGLDIDLDWQIIQNTLQNNQIYRSFNFRKNFLFNDGLAGIFANNNDWGVCLIAGTGANCYGINQDQQIALAGDWGYLLGDQGSGFALGQKLVHHLVKVFDGREVAKGGEDLILQKLEIENVDQLIFQVYLKKNVSLIAKAATILEENLDKYPWIKQIVLKISRESLFSYHAVIKKLGFESGRLPVVFMGSLLSHDNLFSQTVTQEILAANPEAEISQIKNSSAIGAALVAKKFFDWQDLPQKVWSW